MAEGQKEGHMPGAEGLMGREEGLGPERWGGLDCVQS